jgi:hypothetical protein
MTDTNRAILRMLLATTAAGGLLAATPGVARTAVAPTAAREAAPAEALADPTVVPVVVDSDGDVAIDTGAIVFTGDGRPAIFGRSSGGSVTITSVDLTTTGRAAPGIVGDATGPTGDVTITAGDVLTRGARSVGISGHAVGSIGDGPYGPVALGTVSIAVDKVATAGRGATGIEALAETGVASVTAGTVTTHGAGAGGISVAAGVYAVATSEAVTTSGDTATGIRVVSGYAAGVQSGSVRTTGDSSVGIQAEGAAGVLVVSGSVVTTGDRTILEQSEAYTRYGDPSAGIVATSSGGGVRVFSETVSTRGNAATGVLATGFGDVAVDSGVIRTRGQGAAGIEAAAALGDVRIVSADVLTEGLSADGLRVTTGAGRVAIDSGRIETRDEFSAGIRIDAVGGVTIDSEVVATAGGYAHGMDVRSSGGDIAIKSGTVTTTNDNATGILVAATASGGDVVVDAGSVTTRGLLADAVAVSAGSDITVRAGALRTEGAAAAGVFATSRDSVTITAAAIETRGALSAGINAIAYDGTIAIDAGSVTTFGDSADGIYAGARGTITIAAGDVVTNGGTRIEFDPYTGEQTVFGSPIGIGANSYDGDIVITANSVRNLGDGGAIEANSAIGSVAVTAGTVVSGIRTRGGAGTSVTVGTLTADGRGVDAGAAAGTAKIAFDSVTVTGERALGARGLSLFGSVEIDGGSAIVTGDESVAVGMLIGGGAAPFFGNGRIDVASATATGAGAVGIQGEVLVGTGTIVADRVTVASSGPLAGAGIRTEVNGGTRVTVGTVTTSGLGTTGIRANAIPQSFGSAEGAIVIAAGSVATTGASARGISATAVSDVAITAGTVTTSGGVGTFTERQLVDLFGEGTFYPDFVEVAGRGAGGIFAASSRGSVTVNATAVTTGGALAHGVEARSETGAIGIAVGTVSVAGEGANGVQAISGSGAISVTVDGEVAAAHGTGVFASTAGVADVTVGSGGKLRGGEGGRSLAIDAARASVTVRAGGSLSGAFTLTAGDDTLVNGGTLRIAGSARFGGGSDVLTNTGTLIGGGGSIAGLETLDNRGVIELRDGVAGQVLDMGGARLVGGSGSVLGVDIGVSGGLAVADRLVIGGASGTTAVAVRGDAAPTLATGIAIVTSATALPADSFVIDPDHADAGFLRYGAAVTGSTATLTTAPDTEAFEVARIGEALVSFARHGADAWIVRTSELRDATEPHRGVWSQAFVGERSVDDARTRISAAGDHTATVSTRERFRGGQLGVDGASGRLLFGATAGYGSAETRLRASGNSVTVEGWNVGAYAGWSAGAWFANALGKVDRVRVDLDLRSADLRRRQQTTAIGFDGELGYRLSRGRLFVEPTVGLGWSSGSLDAFGDASLRFDPGRVDRLLARSGVRLGGALPFGAGTLRPSASLTVIDALGSPDRVALTSGSVAGTLTASRDPAIGRAELGLAYDSGGGLDVFARARTDFGAQASGSAVRAGIGFRW